MKVYILMADGFEECEALVPADLLMRAGAEVVLTSITDRLEVRGAHGIRVLCDKADYDRRTREFLEKVNAIPPAPGFQSVTYPGQFEARRAAQRAVSGVTVDDNIAAKLVEMAQEKALDIPEELL